MNTSRERILTAVSANQPQKVGLQELQIPAPAYPDLLAAYTNNLPATGGKVFIINGFEQIRSFISREWDPNLRNVSTFTVLNDITEPINAHSRNYGSLESIECALVPAHFGVAENGAVWITEELIKDRVLPFICQHLYILIKAEDIVETMQDAYEKIKDEQYGYGAFIAGPSKTADIEQSLVTGAHGPRTHTVFLWI